MQGVLCCALCCAVLSCAGLNLGAINCETDRRGFVPVDEKMHVLDKAGKVLSNVYCIGDANGKYMLAHAASAQVSQAVPSAKGYPGNCIWVNIHNLWPLSWGPVGILQAGY